MITWASKTPRMRRGGGFFQIGDVVPEGYFTDLEIADLKARGKITVVEQRTVILDAPAEVEAPKPVEVEAPKPVEVEAPKPVEVESEEHEHEHEIDLGDPIEEGRKRRRRKAP